MVSVYQSIGTRVFDRPRDYPLAAFDRLYARALHRLRLAFYHSAANF